ncbi:hypothetical protein GOZ84_06195 [Agrobacterium vitis]|nr:hypothetical protein [Agrobacterium vitis]
MAIPGKMAGGVFARHKRFRVPHTPLCPAGHLPLKEGDRTDVTARFNG